MASEQLVAFKLGSEMGELLRGIGKQGERLMIILDMDKLFSKEEKELLQNVG